MYTETHKKYSAQLTTLWYPSTNCITGLNLNIPITTTECFRLTDFSAPLHANITASNMKIPIFCDATRYNLVEIPAFRRNLLRCLPRQRRYNPIHLIVILYGEATLGNFHPENGGRRSLRILVPSVKLHGLTSHKTVVFILKPFIMDFTPTGRSTHFWACSLYESIWNDQLIVT
jgi:hypothetical protein